MKHSYARLCLAWLAVLGGAVSVALAIFVFVHWWEHRWITFPENLGNERALNLLQSRGAVSADALNFAVIGDINNGTRAFEKVVNRLRREQNMAFLVLLGDCAANADARSHDYFIDEFCETDLDLPTFIVAGNHDVKPGRMEYPEFEAIYGSANFAFIHGRDLFIGLGGIHAPEKLAETLTFLETTLRERRTAAKNVFVFMHYTVRASNDIPTDGIAFGEDFQRLFEKHRVTYVITGHYHRLARTEVNGVTYLVTGGGGARLRRDEFGDLGLFHHLTLIKSDGNSVSEQTIPIPPPLWPLKQLERFERWGLTTILPFGKAHPVAGALGTVLAVAVFSLGLAYLVRSRYPRGGRCQKENVRSPFRENGERMSNNSFIRPESPGR
ncbi:MAG: metallophosphoesterase [Lentisphaeria bacterium]|nr:metallophosphoesterase [Lentisphaeria bacterium]